MAVGKGSIMRASQAGSKSINAKEAEKEEGYQQLSAVVTSVPIGCLTQLCFAEKQTQIEQIVEASIQKYGVLEPLLTWQKGERQFVVLDGNKRLNAVKNLGIETVPVYTISVMDEGQAKEIYEELHRYAAEVETLPKHEVVSSIPSSVPVYLL